MDDAFHIALSCGRLELASSALKQRRLDTVAGACKSRKCHDHTLRCRASIVVPALCHRLVLQMLPFFG